MRRILITATALAAIAVVSGLVTSRIRSDGADGIDLPAAPAAEAGQARWTIGDAQAFDEFDLYWLGEEFMGHKLRGIVRDIYAPPPPIPPEAGSNAVVFLYGNCTPEPENEGKCTLPLAVNIEPLCLRPPGGIAEQASSGPPVTQRGALVQPLAGGAALWTGNARVTINGAELASDSVLLDTIVGGLQSIDPDGVAVGQALAPPSSLSC